MTEQEELIASLFAEAARHNIPMYKVAAEAGMSVSTISQWRSGLREPTLGNYIRVRDAVDRLAEKKAKQIRR